MQKNRPRSARSDERTRPVFTPMLGLEAKSVLLVMALAGFLRLIWLDRPAFRADTIHFWSMAQQKLTFGDVWSNWLQLMGDSAQFPLSAALAMIPTGWLGMPATAFYIRLSDVFFGVAAVGAAWLAGRWLAGRWFGSFCAVFIAINPLHVQLSREAYFYSPLVAGGFLLLACTARAIRFPRSAWTAQWMLLWLIGLTLSAYSHFTGWILAGLVVLVVILRLAFGSASGPARPQAVRLGLCALIVALPLTWLPWALPYSIQKMGNAETKADSIRRMGEVKSHVPDMLAVYAEKMMWGSSGWAVTLLILSALALLAFLVVGGRRAPLRWLAGLTLAGIGAYLVVMKSQGMYEAVRHVSFLFPLVSVLALYGLWSLPRLRGVRSILRAQGRRVVGWGLVVVALLAQGPGTWAAIRITGSPTPYLELQAWGNQHLTRGTPVLIDRWFEPWNELRVYPSTNVVFMFTRPNEPLDVFLQTRWRDGAERFLRDNPDAAFMEIARTYSSEPGVGTWAFPRAHFKHRTVIANEAGLILRDRGQAFREDFMAPDTNRVVVEIFHNQREDALDRARADGQATLIWPGAGWMFVKSGPVGGSWQTADFMDWRLAEVQAGLELHNLTDRPQTVVLVVRALAPRGSKTMAEPRLGSHVFPPGRLVEWRTSAIELPPGSTEIILRDAHGAATPLLVQQWRLEPFATP